MNENLLEDERNYTVLIMIQRQPEPAIKDRFGRTFTTLRLAINERCNLRCLYCMTEDKVFPPDASLLQLEELERLVQITARLGVNKIRITGGEPLLHKSLVPLIRSSKNTDGIESVHVTTNGVLLSKYASELKAAGLSGVNISLDSLSPETFRRVTRRNQFQQVMNGIQTALTTKFDSVKINVVAMRGTTESELNHFVEFTRNHDVTVRFIELMPFDDQQIWKTGQFLRSEALIEELLSLYPELATSDGLHTEHRVFQLPNAIGKLAIIPAYSRNICKKCDRFRITADGRLRNCLYAKHEVDLKSMLRGPSSDEDISQVILDTMNKKPVDGWAAQRALVLDETQRSSMSQIGG